MRKNIASMQITNNDDQNYEFENSLFFDCIVAVVGRFIATCIYSIVEEVLNELWYEWAWCWNGLTDSHRNRGFASLKTSASDKSSRNWEKKRDPGIYDVEASVQTRVFMREAKKTQNSTNYQKKFKSTANKKKHQVDGVQVYERCTNDRDWKTSRNFLIQQQTAHSLFHLFPLFLCETTKSRATASTWTAAEKKIYVALMKSATLNI